MAKKKVTKKKSITARSNQKSKEDNTTTTQNPDESAQIKQAITNDIIQIRRKAFLLLLAVIGLTILLVAITWQIRSPTIEQVYDFETLYQRTLQGYEGPTHYLYNGFAFIHQDGLWYTLVVQNDGNEYLIGFHYGPRDVENIPTPPLLQGTIATKQQIALSLNASLSTRAIVGMYDVAKVVGNQFGFLNRPTYTATDQFIEGFPTITCANATQSHGVIYFTVSNITAVTQHDNCIIVSGTDEQELVRASNALAYVALGIIPQQPSPITFVGTLSLANWRTPDRIDGLQLQLEFTDHDGTPISPTGQLMVTAYQNEQLLENWETRITYGIFSQTGSVTLNLGTTITEQWAESPIIIEVLFEPPNHPALFQELELVIADEVTT